MKTLFQVILLLLPALFFAQQTQLAHPKPAVPLAQCVKQDAAQRSALQTTVAKGFLKPEYDPARANWYVHLDRPGEPAENENPAALRAIKEAKMPLKLQDLQTRGAANPALNTAPPHGEQPGAQPRESSWDPYTLSNFEGNSYNGWYPADNGIAKSNAGWIVTTVNSEIRYLDHLGNVYGVWDFEGFFNDPTLSSQLYDPRVMYDSYADRFIMVVLSGSSVGNSTIILCYSVSNNPNDGWWWYYIAGDPLNSGTWFDYPNIAVSTNEIYITGNLFDGSDNFSQALLYQVEKWPGFTGGSINWLYWYGIDGDPFTLVPASWGDAGAYGPGCYLVCTEGSASGDELYFYDLTQDIPNSPTINRYSVGVPSYEVGANAFQPGSGADLDNGDCRLQKCYYLNGYIYYTYCVDPEGPGGGGWNGACVGRFRWDLGDATQTIYSYHGNFQDVCYPTICYSGYTGLDYTDACLAFLIASSSENPSLQTFNYAADFSTSNWAAAAFGSGVIVSETPSRWGDYTCVQREYNASCRSVWVYGQIGNGFDHQNQVLQLSECAVPTQQPASLETSAKVFPNPVVDLFNLEFDLTERGALNIVLNDAGGKMVRQLYNGRGKTGKNVLTFNRYALPAGTYFVQIFNDNKLVSNEKIVVQ